MEDFDKNLAMWDDDLVWDNIELGLDKKKKKKRLLWMLCFLLAGSLILTIWSYMNHSNSVKFEVVQSQANLENEPLSQSDITNSKINKPIINDKSRIDQVPKEASKLKISGDSSNSDFASLLPSQKTSLEKRSTQIAQELQFEIAPTSFTRSFPETNSSSESSSTSVEQVSIFDSSHQREKASLNKLDHDQNNTKMATKQKEVAYLKSIKISPLTYDREPFYPEQLTQVNLSQKTGPNMILIEANLGMPFVSYGQNSADLTQKESSLFTQGLSLQIEKSLTQHWSLSTGLKYQNLISRLRTASIIDNESLIPSDSAYIANAVYYAGQVSSINREITTYNVINRYHQILLPIHFTYSCGSYQQWRWTAGLDFNLLDWQRGYLPEGNNVVKFDKASSSSIGFLSPSNIILGANYRLSLGDRLGFIGGIKLQYGLGDIARLKSQNTEIAMRMSSVRTNVGFLYSLN